jgi:hypothetical protein
VPFAGESLRGGADALTSVQERFQAETGHGGRPVSSPPVRSTRLAGCGGVPQTPGGVPYRGATTRTATSASAAANEVMQPGGRLGLREGSRLRCACNANGFCGQLSVSAG